MDEMYGFYSSSGSDYYTDKALMSPDNLILPCDYQTLLCSSSSFHDHRTLHHPVFGSVELLSAASAISEAASITPEFHPDDDFETLIKAKIKSHPSYPRLLQAYIDCQKVGAPPETASFLEGIRRETTDVGPLDSVARRVGADPELDEFMETYIDMLVKYKLDLARPFDEATTFLNKMEMQLSNLCTTSSVPSHSDEGAVSSDEDFSGGELEVQESQPRAEDHGLKDRLMRKFGSHIGNLKLEFSKKKKKGKLPKEARQTLLEWWNIHYKWPYPTEADKISLAESTGLDQKQINNWFINQRKRHWKPSEDMHFAIMDNIPGQFYAGD